MNLIEAYKILDIKFGISEKEIRHAYHIKALKNHPDKHNGCKEAHERFIKITEAYNMISNNLNIPSNCETNKSYMQILEEFLVEKFGTENTKNILSFLMFKKESILDYASDFINNYDFKSIIEFIEEYNDILNIDSNIIKLINKNIIKKNKNKNIIINPTIENILKEEVYIFIHDNVKYYIPTWIDQVIYEISQNNLLTINCIPKLPSHISIDDKGNLIIKINLYLEQIKNFQQISIQIINKEYIIDINKLKITYKQNYIIKHQGIPVINKKNIYKIDTYSDVIFCIYFLDLDKEIKPSIFSLQLSSLF